MNSIQQPPKQFKMLKSLLKLVLSMFAILVTQNCSESVSDPYLNRGLDYRGEAAGSQTQMGSEPLQTKATIVLFVFQFFGLTKR